jgi:hypothetical protein
MSTHKVEWIQCDVCGKKIGDEVHKQPGQTIRDVLHKIVIGPCYQQDKTLTDFCNICAGDILSEIKRLQDVTKGKNIDAKRKKEEK